MARRGSLAVALARSGARIERQKRAAAIRAQKEQERKRLAEQRERLKRDKEAYIQSQIKHADEMGKELHQTFHAYNEILSNLLLEEQVPVFDIIRNQYKEEPFTYSEPTPQYRKPALLPVPQKSWLEKLFKAKEQSRLDIIATNESTEQAAKAEYEEMLKKFEEEKELAEKEWAEEQSAKKLAFYKQIDSEEKAYLSLDVDALKEYLDALMELSGFLEDVEDVLENYEFGYQPLTKRLVVDMHIKKRDEIFYAEEFRYVKKTDKVVPVKMAASLANDRLKRLMIELVISEIVIIFNNDRADAINDVVVNLYHDCICCVSAYVEKDTYRKYDLENKSNKSIFMSRQMRICKSLTTGVHAFEYIYGTD